MDNPAEMPEIDDEERYCEDCGQRLSSYAIDMGYTSCKCCMDGTHDN